MRLSRRDLLSAAGLGALSACASGQSPAAPAVPSATGGTKGMSPQDLGAHKARMAAPNALGVTQSSFRRRFAAGMKPTEFAKFARNEVGVSLVSWSGPLMGAITAESLGAIRAANDDQGVRSLLIDPSIGPGLAAADEAARKPALERLKPWLDAAHALSATGLSIDLRGEGDYDTQFKRALDGVRAAAPMFKAAGLQAVVKCLGGYTSHGQFLAALMNQLGDAAVRLEPTFDEWKVSDAEQYHRVRGLELLMPFAACVLADYTDFKPDGESTTLPTRMLVMRVRDPGFRGPVMMQYKGAGDELEGARRIRSLLMRYPIKP